jgi:hypothetical protein
MTLEVYCYRGVGAMVVVDSMQERPDMPPLGRDHPRGLLS